MRPSYPNQGAAPAKRLDPDTIPSPIQVIISDNVTLNDTMNATPH